MRVRTKQRKASAFHCSSANLCSPTLVLWSIVGFIILINVFNILHPKGSRNAHPNLPRPAIVRELEIVEEEESLHLPPPRSRRNPRAVRRKGEQKPRTHVDEFLDESSEIHSMFFPQERIAIDPREGGNDSMHYFPGRVWLDTSGSPIQAHGGGILYDEITETYFWYGENKDGPTYRAHKNGAERVDIIGVSCYSSRDLWAWKNEGIVLRAEGKDRKHDLHKSNVLERPKVIHNGRSGKYVMWMHVDDANYTKASVGVAVSNAPTGPFIYLHSMRPNSFESRDMSVFKDDGGKAYLVYSSQDNSELHICQLTDDYLNVTGTMRRFLIKQHREAPALFKHGGTYYMLTSGCTGWAPNSVTAHAAESILGPWELLGNPCMGGNHILRHTTFFSQATFVLPLPRLPGTFLFMADRWNPSDLRDSRYVWLPMTVGGTADEPMDYSFRFPSWPRVSVYWHRRWRLPEGWQTNSEAAFRADDR